MIKVTSEDLASTAAQLSRGSQEIDAQRLAGRRFCRLRQPLPAVEHLCREPQGGAGRPFQASCQRRLGLRQHRAADPAVDARLILAVGGGVTTGMEDA
jgi:hypothetical protein